ncbi:hypothetical protein TRIUR3_00484 [Triticum urartu]|uniref:Uncharacterized protein n=1 Tax=Triticum urartu TaxID=4572 RepID=M7YLS4_TRIUA|nr:hypothetical protein TRIUR3_00484 [Triticum urartu]
MKAANNELKGMMKMVMIEDEENQVVAADFDGSIIDFREKSHKFGGGRRARHHKDSFCTQTSRPLHVPTTSYSPLLDDKSLDQMLEHFCFYLSSCSRPDEGKRANTGAQEDIEIWQQEKLRWLSIWHDWNIGV